MFGIDDAILWPMAGSLLGGVLRNESQERQASNQIDFQERMSGTAHQREVQDLIAAGLNPMLSAKLGGASSPAGAQANIQDVVSPAVASGQQGKLLAAQLEQIKSQVDLNQANAADARANIWLKNSQIDQLNAQVDQMRGLLGLQETQQHKTAKEVFQVLEQIGLLKRQQVLTGEQAKTEVARQGSLQAQTALDIERMKLTGADTLLRGLQGRHSELDLAKSMAESKFFEGAVGEQSPMIRLILQLISVLNRVR